VRLVGIAAVLASLAPGQVHAAPLAQPASTETTFVRDVALRPQEVVQVMALPATTAQLHTRSLTPVGVFAAITDDQQAAKFNGYGEPSDTQVAVGPTRVLVMVNTVSQVYTRSGAAVGPLVDLNVFFKVPTGYSFNLDGTTIYMTLATLFLAQATTTHLTIWPELGILGIAMITTAGSSGVTGAGFSPLAATLAIVPDIPIQSLAVIVGIDRFMSECRALTNLVGNGVATLVVSRWEGELDRARLAAVLSTPAVGEAVGA